MLTRQSFISCTTLVLLLILALFRWAPPVQAAPPAFDYVYGAFKQNLEGEVNKVAASGWEVFDVGFTPMNGYLVSFRRPHTGAKRVQSYAFELAGEANSQQKANAASQKGWRVFKVCTSAQKVYLLCFRKEAGRGPEYVFEHYLAADCSAIVNEHAKRGLQLVSFGNGGDGYLLCFRKGAPDPHAPEYAVGNAKMAGLNATFQSIGKNHWEVLEIVQASDLLCAAYLRKNAGRTWEYGFETVGFGNIQSKTEELVKAGWEIVGVMANSAMGGDVTDPAYQIRQMAPYTLCCRR